MKTTIIVSVVVSIIAIVMPLAAHHAFSAQYDLNRPMYMDGKVTKVEWVNPHVYVSIDVADKASGTVSWIVELSPPNALARVGLNKTMLQAGMEICVEGFPDKMGIARFGTTSVTLKDSGKVFQTPPGNWMVDGSQIFNAPPSPILYTGKTSCANRTPL